MHDLVLLILPLFGFMLLPIWIPIIAVAVGAVSDRFSSREVTTAERAVAAAKARNAHVRSTPASRVDAAHPAAVPLGEVA